MSENPSTSTSTSTSTPITIPRQSLAWTCLILAYLGVEWIYNQHLLILLTLSSITSEQFHWSEVFGKGIAAFGFSLVLMKMFKRSSVILFAISCAIVYSALTWVFNHAIQSVPSGFRYVSYYTILHRDKVVSLDDKDKVLAFAQNESWYVAPLILSQFYVTLQENQWKGMEESARSVIARELANLEKNKKKYWQQYLKARVIRDKVEAGWYQYSEGMKKYRRYERTRYEDRARKEFERRANLPVGLTRDEFLEKVAPGYKEEMNKVLVPGNERAGLKPIYFKDLPFPSTPPITWEGLLYSYIKEKTKEITAAVAPDVKNIRENARSDDVVSVLVIPPISIGLSLLSMGMNAVSLVMAWGAWVAGRRWVGYALGAGCVGAAVLGFSLAQHVGHRDPYWARLHQGFAVDYPAVAAISSLPMKVQPWVSFHEEPRWIRWGMEWVYHYDFKKKEMPEDPPKKTTQKQGCGVIETVVAMISPNPFNRCKG